MSDNHEHGPECLLCDGEGPTRERVLEMWGKIEADIAAHKCSMIGVPGDEDGPSFTYTIGLTDMGWPEIICVGMNPQTAMILINSMVAKYVESGETPEKGDMPDIANLPVVLGETDQPAIEKYLCQASYRQERVGGPPVSALQLIMSDRKGELPDSTNYDWRYMNTFQPCLSAEGWNFRKTPFQAN